MGMCKVVVAHNREPAECHKFRAKGGFGKKKLSVARCVVSPKVASISRIGKRSSTPGLGRANSFLQMPC